jgi:hypothetical protein
MITQAEKVAFITEAARRFGEVVTRQQLVSLSNEGFKRQFWVESDEYRVGRGKYKLPLAEFGVNMAGLAQVIEMPKQTEKTEVKKSKIQSIARVEEGAIVPKVNDLYVPFGFFDKMKSINDCLWRLLQIFNYLLFN